MTADLLATAIQRAIDTKSQIYNRKSNCPDDRRDAVFLHPGEPVFERTLSRGTSGLPGTAPALARELRQTMAAWRNLGGEPLGTVYLVGGGASVQGAEVYLASQLGVSVLPLPAPRLEGVTPEQAAALPRYAKAPALARESISWRPMPCTARRLGRWISPPAPCRPCGASPGVAGRCPPARPLPKPCLASAVGTFTSTRSRARFVF